MDGSLARILASGERGSAVLARGLALLEFVRTQGPTDVREASAGTDIPLATCYRIVGQLCEAGFLIENGGRLHAGDALAPPHDAHGHLVEFARPVMQQISAATQAACLLTVRVHDLALTLHGVPGRTAPRSAFVVGETHGLYAGASATPLLAFAPAALRERILQGPLRPYTSSTPNRDALIAKIARIRERGYDVSTGEVQPLWTAVGAPVFVDGDAMCCLSVAEPSARFDEASALHALRAGVAQLTSVIPHTIGHDLWTPSEPDGGLL